jgi:hypothetical protein
VNEPVDVSCVLALADDTPELEEIIRQYSGELTDRGMSFEWVLVLDGLGEARTARLKARLPAGAAVRLLHFNQSFGEERALTVGYREARGRMVISLPSYMQLDPGDIHHVLDALDRDYDLVAGWRVPRVDPWINRLQSWLYKPRHVGLHRRAAARPQLRPHRPAALGHRRGAGGGQRQPLPAGARAPPRLPRGRGARAPPARARPARLLRHRRVRAAHARRGRAALPHALHHQAAALLRRGRRPVGARRHGHLRLPLPQLPQRLEPAERPLQPRVAAHRRGAGGHGRDGLLAGLVAEIIIFTNARNVRDYTLERELPPGLPPETPGEPRTRAPEAPPAGAPDNPSTPARERQEERSDAPGRRGGA